MIENERDALTGIYNDVYLDRHYLEYTHDKENVHLIMIDIQKFKSINDVFGHRVGDDYLCFLAKMLSNTFDHSIVVRLHGDEFLIVTDYQEEEIKQIFLLCSKKIELAVQSKKLPRVFQFNAGVCKIQGDLTKTMEIADYLMYDAKKRECPYQFFTNELLLQMRKRDQYLESIDEHLREEKFSYASRGLYTKTGNSTNIIQMYTKSSSGMSIFENQNYNFLRNTSRIFQLDLYNIQMLLEKNCFTNQVVTINLDYKSLLMTNELMDYLSLLFQVKKISFQQIILSIDISGIESGVIDAIISRIMGLKSLGFQVRLDNFESTIGSKIWEESVVDYIKVYYAYWHEAMMNSRLENILRMNAKIYEECGIVPVFDRVENQDEYEFLNHISSSNSLFSGNYFSQEKQLKLKK